MTDPTLPPEQEAVRRLLADARHDGPTPPEVVARLDATLASLAAERRPSTTASTSPTAAPVVDLAARRRRMAGIGLLAAAAVVVAGVAIGQGLPSSDSSSDASSASAGEAGGSERSADDDSGGADSGGAESQEMQPQPKESLLSPGSSAYPQVFTSDARPRRRSPRRSARPARTSRRRAGRPRSRGRATSPTSDRGRQRPCRRSTACSAGRLPPRGRRHPAGRPLHLRRPDDRALPHAACALTHS